MAMVKSGGFMTAFFFLKAMKYRLKRSECLFLPVTAKQDGQGVKAEGKKRGGNFLFVKE